MKYKSIKLWSWYFICNCLNQVLYSDCLSHFFISLILLLFYKFNLHLHLESSLLSDMAWMSHFCRQWRLKPSASKTISSVFHLHNTSAGGESTLDLCYASFEEIPELQHPRHATGNCRNLQCGDDSILRANVTRDKGSPCLGALGGLDLGVGLAGCRFLSAGATVQPVTTGIASFSFLGQATQLHIAES